MAEGKPQPYLISSSSNSSEIVSKLSDILAAIDRCGCQHCLELLKIGLGTNPTQTIRVPTPEPTGDGICLL